MRLRTKYFGEIECREEDKLHFPEGLFGFEEEKEFFLLPFEGGEGSLLCFQSAATPGLAFVALNPFSLKPDYAPVLTDRELEALGVERSEDLCFYTLCVVRSPVGESTVNLRCPVAVNDRTAPPSVGVRTEGGGDMLILQRKEGESLLIGDEVEITVLSVEAGRARLAIQAPRSVTILRSELKVAADANREAADEEVSPLELLGVLKGQEPK